MYKRKISRMGTGYKKRRLFVPGHDRVGGFYGRYSRGSEGSGELKFFDTAVDLDPIPGNGTIVASSINLVPQGITESNRIGRKCAIRHISWKYQLQLLEIDALATPVSAASVRIIIYIDKQANGAAAAVTDIVEANSFQAHYNLANQSRFTFLMDKVHTLNYLTLASDTDAVVSSANVKRDYTFVKRCNIPIEFDSTTGALTEIRSNNIGMMMLTSTGTATLTSVFRVRYSDGSR